MLLIHNHFRLLAFRSWPSTTATASQFPWPTCSTQSSSFSSLAAAMFFQTTTWSSDTSKLRRDDFDGPL